MTLDSLEDHIFRKRDGQGCSTLHPHVTVTEDEAGLQYLEIDNAMAA